MTTIQNPASTVNGYAARLAGRLPKDEQHNGLKNLAEAMVTEPRTVRFAVIAYDTVKVIDDVDDGSATAVVRVLRIEPIENDTARKQAAQLLLKALQACTGAQLSLDDLDSAHDDAD